MTRTPATAEPNPWEIVHLVKDFYDVPLSGVADHQGHKHVFILHDETFVPIEGEEGEFDRILTYALYRAPNEVIEAMLEQHAIFERWHQVLAKDRKKAEEHHPAMPEDRPRYDALTPIVEQGINALHEREPDAVRLGHFHDGLRERVPGNSRWSSFSVQWVDVPTDATPTP